MIKYYKVANGGLRETRRSDKSSRIWIDAYSPNTEELEQLAKLTKISIDDLRMALDEDERPRIEVAKNYVMIIFRSPFANKEDEIETSSIGIFLTKKYVVTLHLYYTGYVIPIFEPSKHVPIKSNTEFVYYMLSEITKAYSKVLTKIEKQVDIIEDEAIKNTDNIKIEKISDTKKTLIYFHRSLMVNRVVVLTIIGKNLKLIDNKYIEKFKDLHTEIFQLLEMTVTYKDLLKGAMDSYSSIMSNKLGETVRVLTILTALLTIPTFFVNLYSMNVALPYQQHPLAFPLLILFTFLIMIVTWTVIKVKKWI